MNALDHREVKKQRTRKPRRPRYPLRGFGDLAMTFTAC